jgi:succinate dehydrogenase / fumarate reductase flavoprotein subunit
MDRTGYLYDPERRTGAHLHPGSGGSLLRHDVVVVGAGLAGMRAAIEAKRAGADVAIVSKLHPTRSHSGSAEGGINAALGNASEDSPEIHTFDTVKGSDYLGDQDAIEIMCTEAPGDIYELEHMGAVFSRFADGRIAQRPFGAAGSPRTVYSADITGHVLIHVLYEQLLKYEVPVYEEFFALDLAVDGGRCVGVLAWDIVSGGVHAISAHNTILATGGVGRMYYGTTNAYACTGDGMSMAWRAGVPLKDMEFMQFHPTTLKSNGVLITEGCRGEGAYLRNADGERFMAEAAPNAMELASRDVVSRAETREIEAGRGVDGCVLLDLTHLGAKKIHARLPGSRELAMDYAGVDPILEPIPVRPGAHYHMGGVDTDVHGQTILPGLYAAGECACVSVHGANRLGGNSLMETITYGRRAGLHAGDDALANRNGALVPESTVRDADARIRAIFGRSGGQRPWQVREELATSMYDDAGVFRTSERLERCLTKVRELRERGRDVVVDDTGDRFNTDLVSVLELESMLEMADCLVTGGLARTESRGAHTRLDHPERDDEHWMKHTLTWNDGGAVRLDYKPVTVTRFEPMVRSY